jgi:hypothetical protein
MDIYNQSWLFTIVVNAYTNPNPPIINKCEWQTIATRLAATRESKGSWVQATCEAVNAPHTAGNSYEQSLAQFFGATAPINGSWIEALAYNLIN